MSASQETLEHPSCAVEKDPCCPDCGALIRNIITEGSRSFDCGTRILLDSKTRSPQCFQAEIERQKKDIAQASEVLGSLFDERLAIKEAITALRKTDCGAWLSTGALGVRLKGDDARLRMQAALDALYKVAGVNGQPGERKVTAEMREQIKPRCHAAEDGECHWKNCPQFGTVSQQNPKGIARWIPWKGCQNEGIPGADSRIPVVLTINWHAA